jgi:hypothetical protein
LVAATTYQLLAKGIDLTIRYGLADDLVTP